MIDNYQSRWCYKGTITSFTGRKVFYQGVFLSSLYLDKNRNSLLRRRDSKGKL